MIVSDMEILTEVSTYTFNPLVMIDFDESTCLSSTALASYSVIHLEFLAKNQPQRFGVKFSSSVDCSRMSMFFKRIAQGQCSSPALKLCNTTTFPGGDDKCMIDCGCSGEQCELHVVITKEFLVSTGTWELCELWSE